MIEYKLVDIALYEEEINLLFNKQPFGRYLSDRKISKSNSIDFEWNNLINYSKGGIIYLAIDENSEVIGIIGFHNSKWDTDVFQKRLAFLQYFLVKESIIENEREVAEKLLERFHEWTSAEGIQVVISKLDTQYYTPIYILQQNGYIFYETITYQSLDVTSVKRNIADGIQFRYACEADSESLKMIALKNTFTKSHFYLDNKFSIEKVELMYACWIESALKSSQKIVIVEDSNQIAGAFIYDVVDYSATLNRKFGVWKSAFVDSRFRDKGIGLKLFKATLQSCINDGVDIIDSSLVDKNIVSQSFHNKLGFRLVNTNYTFHKWFEQ